MPDTDPNQAVIGARANLKDTAKWIVTILGATIVVVIGGGLIAKIADLDWTARLIAAGSLVVLTLACLVPLRAAVGIIAAEIASFESIARSAKYAQARGIVNNLLFRQYPPDIDTVEKLFGAYAGWTATANDPRTQPADLRRARKALDELQPRVREVIELSNTEFLRLKFDRMVRLTTWVLPVIGIALFLFLVFVHHDDQAEKQLAKPVLLQVPWSAAVEAAMNKAGLDEKCYVPERPQLLQVSEKSGLRAGVLAIPRNLGAGCPAVRVIVTNSDGVYADD